MPGLPELEIICIDVEKHERRPQREKLEPHVNPDVLECHGAPPCRQSRLVLAGQIRCFSRGATDGPSFLFHLDRVYCNVCGAKISALTGRIVSDSETIIG